MDLSDPRHPRLRIAKRDLRHAKLKHASVTMSIATIDPATGKTVRTFEAFSAARVNESLDQAVAASQKHRRTTFADRASRMRKAAAILDAESRELGQLMTLEMGKPIKAAVAEAEKCATACRYYADNAERFLADRNVEMEGGKSWVAFQPIGVVLAIMPWNFPFWQVFRFCGTGAHGWQCRHPQARVERSAVRAWPSKTFFAAPDSPMAFFRLCSSAQTWSRESSPTVASPPSRSPAAKELVDRSRAPPARISRSRSWSSAAAIRSS